MRTNSPDAVVPKRNVPPDAPPVLPDQRLTVRQVAYHLQMTEDAVRRLIRQKRIKASNVSKTKRIIYRVEQDVLNEFLAA